MWKHLTKEQRIMNGKKKAQNIKRKKEELLSAHRLNGKAPVSKTVKGSSILPARANLKGE